MPHYRYVIVGGGMAADAAIHGIREVDPSGSIGLIGAESHPPYNRPPLSKALWKGKPLDTVWRKPNREGVDLHLGRSVRTLDAREKSVTDDQGTAHTWDMLLLATGGSPRRFSFGNNLVIYFRTLDDYVHLRTQTEHGQRFAVIGGGFIGSEIAAALAMNGKNVTLLFPGKGIGGRVFPLDLAEFLNTYYRQKGVDVQPGERIIGLDTQGSQTIVVMRGGRRL